MVSDVGFADAVEEERADRAPEITVGGSERPALEIPFALAV
jgi:hypothetical protein